MLATILNTKSPSIIIIIIRLTQPVLTIGEKLDRTLLGKKLSQICVGVCSSYRCV